MGRGFGLGCELGRQERNSAKTYLYPASDPTCVRGETELDWKQTCSILILTIIQRLN